MIPIPTDPREQLKTLYSAARPEDYSVKKNYVPIAWKTCFETRCQNFVFVFLGPQNAVAV